MQLESTAPPNLPVQLGSGPGFVTDYLTFFFFSTVSRTRPDGGLLDFFDFWVEKGKKKSNLISIFSNIFHFSFDYFVSSYRSLPFLARYWLDGSR